MGSGYNEAHLRVLRKKFQIRSERTFRSSVETRHFERIGVSQHAFPRSSLPAVLEPVLHFDRFHSGESGDILTH